MGEGKKDALRVNFDRKLKVEFHGSQDRCANSSKKRALRPLIHPSFSRQKNFTLEIGHSRWHAQCRIE